MSEPMSMHLDKVVTTTKVSANIDDGGERREVVLKETEEVLAEKFFEHHPIKVYMDYSTTINLGNYESAKVSIGMSIPVGKEVPKKYLKKVEKAHEFARSFIEERVSKEVNEIQEYLKKKREQ